MANLVIATNSVDLSGADQTPGSGTPQYFTSGNPISSIPATVLPGYWCNQIQGEIVNAITQGNLTPSGSSWDQLWQAILSMATMTDTGSVNALAVAPPVAFPAPASIPNGTVIEVTPAYTNTSSTPTLAASGGSAETITTPLAAALKPGDIVAGTPCRLMKATSTWWLLGPNANPVLTAMAGFSGLSGSAAGSTKTASWTIGELIGETVAAGISYKGANQSLSFNGATTGANGMDTGSVPTSADLYVYAIYNPSTATWASLGTTSGSGSNNYTGSHMPAGYTASVLIWVGKTDSSANIVQFSQVSRSVYIPTVVAMSNGGSTTQNPAASISLTSIVPAIAKKISGYMTSSYTASYSFVMGPTSVMGTSGGIFTGLGLIVNSSFTGGTGIATPFSDFPLLTAQTVYYFVSTSASGTLLISGFSF